MVEAHPKLDRPVKVLGGWRRLLPVYLLNVNGRWTIKLFFGRLLAWLACLLLFSYIAGGVALYANDRYRNHLENISLWDRLYPPHWSHYREARGNSLIHNAQTALEGGQFTNAVHLLRAGLARNPAHVEGRLLLADLYQVAKRFDLAESVLLEGLEYPQAGLPAQELLQRTITYLFQRQRDEEIVAITQDLLPRVPGDQTDLRDYLVMAQANALFFRGNFDQAEDLIRQFDLQLQPSARRLSAQIEWQRGFRTLALTLIQQLATEFPRDPEIYRLRIEWLAATDATDRARQLSLLRRIEYPAEVQARLDYLFALDRAGDDAAVQAESEALIRQFRAQAQPLLMLGDFAANAGRPAIADLAFTTAQAQNQPTSGLALMRVEALIVQGDYQAAVSLSRELLDSNPDWKADLAPVFNGLQSIAHYALGDRESADLYLNDFLNQRDLRAENLVAVSNRLLAVGAQTQARRVLLHAVQIDPLNQPALTSLVRFELEFPDSADLSTHLHRLLSMRRPSPELLRQAYDTLGRDRFIFLAQREQLLTAIGQALAGQSRTSI